jgi:RNA polymerase-binding transcription factor DksA
MTAKKISSKTAKKTAAKKASARKGAHKKTAVKQTSAKGPTAAAAVEQPSSGPEPASAAAAKEAAPRKRASELGKRASHTPAVFKVNKRPAHVTFTIEDVRDIIRRRAKEEQAAAAEAARQNPPAAAKPDKAPSAAPAPTPVPTPVPGSAAAASNRHSAASLDDILGLSGGGMFGNQGNKEVPAKFRKYYDMLMQLREEVSSELNMHSNDTLKRSQKEDTGDISISMDAGTDNFDRDFALSLLSSEQEALKEIDAAIKRIHNGTYGICEVTGEPIAAARLEAVPFTRFSLEGQRQHEATSRRRSDRGGSFLSDGSGDTISFGEDDSDN